MDRQTPHVQNTPTEVSQNMHGSLAKDMTTTELNVNRLTATLFSNLRARLQQATSSYKCNQGHGWI